MIEVHRMGRGAVGKRRLQRRRLESLADDGCFFLGAFLPRDLSADFGVLFLAAGECDAKAIPHRELRRIYRFRRDLFELRLGYEPSNFSGDLHDVLQRIFHVRSDRYWSSNFLLHLFRVLVARRGDDFSNGASRGKKFDWNYTWIADNFAT